MSYLTFKYRIKDKTSRKRLAAHAKSCNYIWNFCVATQHEAENRWKQGRNIKWPTAFDLIKLTSGVSKELNLHSQSINAIAQQFTSSRDIHKFCPKFRSSYGTHESLPWIPFKASGIKLENSSVVYGKRRYSFWKSREIQGEIKTGSFVRDSLGRWYICFVCLVEDDLTTGTGEIGIDLGLKSLATCSDEYEILAMKFYRRYEDQLAKAQRSKNKLRVRKIHAKIKNSRKDHLHKETTKLANANKLIVVGDVSSSKLAKTKMAKSVLDAGWCMFKNMLGYKLARRPLTYFKIVCEARTTVTCSICGCITGPKGLEGLRIRFWECKDCGAQHHRDVNSARNILRIGLGC